jgi:uncharacterized protein
MRNKLKVVLIGLIAVAASAALQAAENPAEAPNPNDPTVNQVYEAARAGHLDQAKQMMAIVLAHHPQSSRAHYVAAEIDADLKNYGDAREELSKAEQLDPGLPNVNPRSVAELRKEIGAPAPAAQSGVPSAQARGSAASLPVAASPAKSFPWGFVAIVAAVVFVLWLLLRRRQAAVPGYSAYPPGTMPNTSMGPGPMMPPPGGFPSVMGAGSGLVGGLASGLAVGAGIAAGEELVEHAFGHGREGANVVPERDRFAGNEGAANVDPNADLGGPDFGVSDGGGWDDGGSSGGDSGGGDWT